MIPKVIHYCWFGGNPLPRLARDCIESWKKYCPGYEIREWNESNFDLECCQYVKEAASVGMWAFVSDYARFKILYTYGGIYFDTDVELIKSMDDILAKGAFMGIEKPFDISSKQKYMINPGVGIALEKEMPIIGEILHLYENEKYLMKDGNLNKKTVLNYVTEVLYRHGYDGKNCISVVGGITIYPDDFFCPMNYSTGLLTITENTRSIHHYEMSWKSDYEKRKKEIERRFRRQFGDKAGFILYEVLIIPIKMRHKIEKYLKKKCT